MEQIEVNVSNPVTPELEREGDLGSEDESSGFAITMAKTPICHKLTDIFAAFEKPIPQNLRLYDRFSLWLIPHRLGVLRRRGLAEPVSVGVEIEYLAGGATCSVVTLLPSPEFVHFGSLSASVKIGGSLQASGECTVGAALNETGGQTVEKAFAGLTLSTESQGSAALQFSADIVTPYISAVGMGSSRAEWRFNKNKEALFGRDIET